MNEFQDGWWFKHPKTGKWTRCDTIYETLGQITPEDEPPRFVERGVMLDEQTSLNRGRVELDQFSRKADRLIFAMRAFFVLLYTGTFLLLWRLGDLSLAFKWLGFLCLIEGVQSFFKARGAQRRPQGR